MKRTGKIYPLSTPFFTSLVLFISVLSCFKDSNKSKVKSEIPGERGVRAILGSAYDPFRGKILPHNCIALKSTIAPSYSAYEATVNYFRDAELDLIASKMAGSISAAVPIYPGVEAGGTLGFATSMAKTEASSNLMYTIRINRDLDFIGEYKQSDFLNSILADTDRLGLQGDAKKAHIQERCGQEFVSKIIEGASLVVILNLDYGTEINKKKFDAQMKLSLAGGIGTVNAGATILNDTFAESIVATLGVKQIGGDPEQIFRIFPNGFPRCRFNVKEAGKWADECNKALNNVLAYATGDSSAFDKNDAIRTFPTQLGIPAANVVMIKPEENKSALISLGADPDNTKLVPLAYRTTPNSEILPQELSLHTEVQSQIDDQEISVKNLLDRLLSYEGIRRKLFSIIDTPIERSNSGMFLVQAYKQLGLINSALEEINEKLSNCWQAKKGCKSAEVQTEIEEISSKYPIDMHLISSADLNPSIKDWCIAAGPYASGSNLFLQEDNLLQQDSATLHLLFEQTGAPVLRANQDGSFSRSELADRCLTIEQNLILSEKINLDSSLISDKEKGLIKSLSPINSLHGVKQISARGNLIEAFPYLDGLENLVALDLGSNPFYSSKDLNIENTLTFPSSIRCLDISNPPGVVDSNRSKQMMQTILDRLRIEAIIMRGWQLNATPSENTNRIYVHSLNNVEQGKIIEKLKNRKSPIVLFLPDNTINKSLFGSYGSLTISVDNQNVKCGF